MNNTICIIVTYNPNIDLLDKTVLSIKDQVDKIIIINNNTELDLKNNYSNVVLYNLGCNKGIAYAQNYGVNIALNDNPDFILLSDQDSIFPDYYVIEMKNNADKYKGYSVFCPVFIDKITGTIPNVMKSKFKSVCPPDNPMDLAMGISSGSFIRAELFRTGYNFNENLFIDYVDNEWCWRLTYDGKKILLIPSIKMMHQLGDGTRKLLGRTKVLHSNIRYYYILRNGYYLVFHCKYLSLKERIELFIITKKLQVTLMLIYKSWKLIFLYFNAFYCGFFKCMGKANKTAIKYTDF